jgi:hypothetical protein|tara:strand:+ start:18657 stop:19235 length:579 start_codon:yes stop_codon:yes gene_type:complete
VVDELLHPIQKWPERGPIDLVTTITSYIEGKTVCDIGCGAGDLLYEMRRLGLTDNIIGIENDNFFYDHMEAKEVVDREFLIRANFTEISIPKADVYLLWVPFDYYPHIIQMISPSIVIDCIQGGEGHKEIMSRLTFIEEITYQYDERPYSEKGKLKNNYRGENWPLQGERTITVYEKTKDDDSNSHSNTSDI